MKKILQLAFALFATVTLHAQAVVTDGVFNYTITDEVNKAVEITGYVDGVTPTANLVIPSSVDVVDPEIPELSDTFTVTSVGASAFISNTVTETITLPATVTNLGDQSFSGNSNLTTVNLDNVEVLASKSFTNCGNLSNVGSMEKVVSIGDYCFNNNFALTNYQFSDALTTIGVGAIYSSTANTFKAGGPETINIPGSVTSTGNILLGRLWELRAVQLNWTSFEGITIGANNFFRNLDLSAIQLFVPTGTKALYQAHASWGTFAEANIIEGTLADYVKVLGVNDKFTDGDYEYIISSTDPKEVAVSSTTSTASEITIPSTATEPSSSDVYSVTAIASAFQDNTTITSVVLPSSVVTLQNNAFSGASNLESINLENIVTTETQNALYGTTKLTSLDLSSLQEIGNFTFNTTGLTNVNLPNAVTIARGAFGNNAQLTSINIGSSVTSIGTKAFINCTALTGVQVNWTDSANVPVLDITQDDPATEDTNEGNASFLDVDTANVTLYVPTGTAALYGALDGWKDFNIVEGTLSFEDIVNNSLNISVGSDVITVKSSSAFNNGALSIYDITGRLLVSEVLNGASVSANISNLSSGVYIVKISEGNAELVKRFVKQ